MAEPVDWSLSPKARADLEDIWRFGERAEIVPPVRLHTHGRHTAIYRVLPGRIAILRVVHVRAEWRTLF